MEWYFNCSSCGLKNWPSLLECYVLRKWELRLLACRNDIQGKHVCTTLYQVKNIFVTFARNTVYPYNYHTLVPVTCMLTFLFLCLACPQRDSLFGKIILAHPLFGSFDTGSISFNDLSWCWGSLLMDPASYVSSKPQYC